jgi:hypothetical protein
MNNLSKKSQLAYRGRKARKGTLSAAIADNGLRVPEAALQGQAEDMLDAIGLEWRRVPDNLWRYLKQSAPAHIVKQLADRWKGKPDLLILLPIGGGYSLCKEIEIKALRGKLSPAQEDYIARMPVEICRTPEQTMAAVDAAQLQAKKCARCMAGAK